MLKLEKKSISKFHFPVKLYEIRKKSYDTKLFTTYRITSLNQDIFSYEMYTFLFKLKKYFFTTQNSIF